MKNMGQQRTHRARAGRQSMSTCPRVGDRGQDRRKTTNRGGDEKPYYTHRNRKHLSNGGGRHRVGARDSKRLLCSDGDPLGGGGGGKNSKRGYAQNIIQEEGIAVPVGGKYRQENKCARQAQREGREPCCGFAFYHHGGDALLSPRGGARPYPNKTRGLHWEEER